MPQMNGHELITKIKELQPRVKVILMSTFGINDKEFSRMLPSVEIGLISKPVSMKNLVKYISKTLQSKEAYRSRYMKNIVIS